VEDPSEPESTGSKSSCSSIPSEHEAGVNHSEYMRRYALRIVTITHSHDSHGLFDFEKRQGTRESLITSRPGYFVRENLNCKMTYEGTNIKEEFKSQGQLLIELTNVRNQFVLKTPILYQLKNAENEEQRKLIKTRDFETFYNEQGVQTLMPYEMCERMYMLVKSMTDGDKDKQEYVVKKGDILKMGRTKLLVRDINILQKNQKIEEHNS
jgi:hypothetical protein